MKRKLKLNRTLIVILVAVIAILVPVISSCLPGQAPAVAPPPVAPEPVAPEPVAPEPVAPVVEYPLGQPIIRIAGQGIASGMNADYGRQMVMGAMMARDEINAAGGILGSMIEIDFMDSLLSPPVALKNFIYQAEEWGADLYFGFDLLGPIEAIMPHLPEYGIILTVSHNGNHRMNEDIIFKGKPGSSHVFRMSSVHYLDGYASAMFFSDRDRWPGIKTWGSLAADYEYGYEVEDFFEEYMEKYRPDIERVGRAVAPYGTADFSTQIAALMAKKPNLIIATPWAGEGVSMLRQAVVAGLFEQDWFKVWFQAMGGSVDIAEGISMDVEAGNFEGKLWGTARYLWNQSDSPENLKFVAGFQEKFAGRYPNYSAWTTYTIFYLYKQVIEETGTLDAETLIKAIEGMMVDSTIGPIEIRAEDHTALYTVPIGRYTYDLEVANIAFLTDFTSYTWEQYFRNPPDYQIPDSPIYVEGGGLK